MIYDNHNKKVSNNCQSLQQLLTNHVLGFKKIITKSMSFGWSIANIGRMNDKFIDNVFKIAFIYHIQTSNFE